MKTDRWSSYYNLNSGRGPRKLLLEALAYLPENAKQALELGAGDLTEVKLLLDNDMSTTAVDSSEASAELAREIHDSNFCFIHAPYDEYDFPIQQFDLVSAQLALPFTKPGTLQKVMEGVVSSLKQRGIFVGHFFGPNDEWNTKDSQMTFTTRNEVETFFSTFELIKLQEIEVDRETAAGVMKHWHIFEVIAQKKQPDA